MNSHRREPSDLQVSLRWPEDDDLEDIVVAKNDPIVARGVGAYTRPVSQAQGAAWIARHRSPGDEDYVFVIDLDGQVVGHVGLYKTDFRVRSAEFGILLGAAGRGKGLGRLATSRCLDFGFGQLNLRRISLHVSSSNDVAIHLYETMGFKPEGRAREAIYRDGQYHDRLDMAILREEWSSENP